MKTGVQKAVAVLVMAGLVTGARGATEFEESVPLDLAKIFLNIGNTPDVGLYTDIMDGFPDFDIPGAFTVLGSLDQGMMQRVVLATGLEREAAVSALRDALAEAGWQELPVPEEVQQPRGFVPSGSRQTMSLAGSLCHDDHGNMTVMVFEGEQGNLVNLMRTNIRMFPAMQPRCADQVTRAVGAFGRMNMVPNSAMEHMPALRMPQEAGTGPALGFFSGGGGSPNDWETRANLGLDWNMEDLFDYFAEQIEEQGWTRNSAWVDPVASGGVWAKSPEEDLDLLAILNVIETAKDVFDLKLRVLVRTDQPRNSGIGVIDVISP